MASGKDFASGAIGGATTGWSFGGPWGAAIGGIGGGLLGMLSGSDDEMMSFADVDLQRDNPDLWAELQNLEAMSQQYEKMYNARMQGPTMGERAQVEQGRSRLEEQQKTRGMGGSSAGARMMGEYNNQAMSSIQQRAFEEAMSLLSAQQNVSQARSQGILSGQNAIVNQGNQQVQNQIGSDTARNQFMSGLINTGLKKYANDQYTNSLKQSPYYSQGIPGGSY